MKNQPAHPDLMTVVWEEPPPDRRGRSAFDWNAALKPLRGRPGQWAQILGPFPTGDAHHKKAQGVRRNLKKAGFGDQYEVVGRTKDDGKGYVYARFVGES